MSIERIGIVGFGQMGTGIALVCAKAGLDVVAYDLDARSLDRGFSRLDVSLDRLVTGRHLSEEAREIARGRVRGVLTLKELSDRDLIIEAVVELADTKTKVFAELDRICGPETIFTSNTSSLTIIEIAAATKRPDRFAGLHFFNPPVVMKLVEIARALTTSEATIEALQMLVRRIGHKPIVCSDTPGFVVNRLLVPYLLDAIRALDENVATPEEIDTAIKLGLRYPMGPFELLDYTGLDTILSVSNQFFAEFHSANMAPPPLLKRMVLAGHLGVKSRKGFYDYGPDGKRAT
jgi:3-hydroxybutyryl-CoA dehydrogenase